MKSLHFSFLGLLLISFILSFVSSQQLPFIVPDYDLAGLVDQDPIQLDDDPFDNDDLSIHNEPAIPPPIWSLCGDLSKHLLIPDKDGVTIDPAQPIVGANLTVTVSGTILKRVTGGNITVDLRLMKFIKVTPTFDLCEQLDSDLFEESNVSCPLEKGPITLVAKKYIPDETPKVPVQGNITLTNQNGETLTCVHIDVVLKGKDGKPGRWGIW